MQALEPQMVLFVHHDSKPILDQQRGAGAYPSIGVQARQLLADQMPLVQQLSIGSLQPVEAELDGSSEQYRVPSRRLNGGQNVLSFGLRVPALEHPAGEIPGQPDAGREHQVTGRPAGIEPAHSAIGQQAEINHSSTRSRSRSSAASSKFSVSTA